MATILPPAKTQFFDGNGAPLALGYVHFYVPGTLTRKNTWQDKDLTVLNANPVRLDADGRALIFGTGGFRQIVTDVNLVQIWDQYTEGLVTDADLIGQYITQIFTSPTNFTPGTTTQLTLTTAPLPQTAASMDVHFDGVYQMPTTYSLAGAVLTFTSAISTGVLAVSVRWATPFTDGTFVIPTGSVTAAMLADSAVTTAKINDGAVTAAKLGAAAVTAAKLSPDAVHGQTADTAPSLSDEVMTWETSSTALRKVTVQNLFDTVGQLSTVTPELAEDFAVIYEGDSASAKKVTLSALQTLIGGLNTQTFSGSGTWTKPAGGTVALIRAWGAGASGGSGAGPGGGGGGAYSERMIALASLGATETVTIGAGGAAVTGGNGNNGGNTTFGAWLTAYGGGFGAANGNGGGGGGLMGAGTNVAAGSFGGAAPKTSSGVGNLPTLQEGGGGGGCNGLSDSSGGDAYLGGGGGAGGGVVSLGGISKLSGNGGAYTGGATGTAGTAPAGGGGAAQTAFASGAGAAGRCEVYVW